MDRWFRRMIGRVTGDKFDPAVVTRGRERFAAALGQRRLSDAELDDDARQAVEGAPFTPRTPI
tara:strand:+ start:774 stop:962 length:189 start_codon:yes stop_codon:yes gene_type:complete